MIYLDHAAATPILPKALEIFCQSLSKDFANPAAKHSLGKSLAKQCDVIREKLKKQIKAREGEIIFTSSATESNNFILSQKHFSSGCLLTGDHPGTVKAARFWIDNLFEISSQSSTDDIVNYVCEKKPDVFSISHVDGQSGLIYDVKAIAEGIKKSLPQCHIHVDAVQSFSKLDINLRGWKIDSLCMSGHKIGSPKGISYLWLKQPDKFEALIHGGGQEKGLRSSTVNAPLIFSLEKTCEIAPILNDQHLGKIKELNQLMRNELTQAIFPYKMKETSPYILMFILPEVSSDIVLRHLEQKEIYISSTSACSSRIKGENEVFHFHNIETKFHKNVLRVSFSHSNTIEEVKTLIKELKLIYSELKNLGQKRK